MITEFIDPMVFLISLCIGLLYTYVTISPPKVVIKYPTPYNAGKVTYIDQANVCYKYDVQKVDCPRDRKGVKTIKIQGEDNIAIVA